jgi:hypothetical protein
LNVTLRNRSEPNWEKRSTHTVTRTIPNTVSPPLTQSHEIVGVRINLVQDNPNESADNWDIVDLSVTLLNQGSPPVCQLKLNGTSTLQDGSTGLVRLSKNPGDSGVGPSSKLFPTGAGSGC